MVFVLRNYQHPLIGVFLAFLTIVFARGFLGLQRSEPAVAPPFSGEREMINPELSARVEKMSEGENLIARTLWADERQAQRLSRHLEEIWNHIRMSSLKWPAVMAHSIGDVYMGAWREEIGLSSPEIEIWHSKGEGELIASDEWSSFVRNFESLGWILSSLELRHTGFVPDKGDGVFESRVRVSFALENPRLAIRSLIDGLVTLKWRDGIEEGRVLLLSCDCRDLELRINRQQNQFKLVYEAAIPPPENAYSIDPLLVADLDKDGVSEIILAGKNLLVRCDKNGAYRSEPLCTFPPGLISTGLLVDANLDGALDLVCVKHEGMVILLGSSQGVFDQPERLLWKRSGELKYPMVLSGGDFDRDGDVDLFLGQYRVPYEGGSLPSPYYDANDGNPSYLFRNEGNLEFADVTEASGLADKRYRRIYSASFADMDGENGSDLVLVSDFAGVDLFLNNGRGRFRDVSDDRMPDGYGFGMAHALGDFNADGELDLIMAGMTSATVERLESLGLYRDGLTDDRSLRAKMTYGTRLFRSTSSGEFTQDPRSETLRRSGWTWGVSAADFNNDSWPDIFVGNGLESRDSVQDYESEYWLHDAFVADSEGDPVAYLYFKDKFARTRGRGHSYGGYDRDRLYLSNGGVSFVEVGYLMGVGAQRDSRNVVAEDLNRDGKMDLLVTSFKHWPDGEQTLRLFLNQLEGTGHWIGFRVESEASSPSSMGVQIIVEGSGRKWINEIVSGDSYRSQHSRRLHFGLGSNADPVAVSIRWPDGFEKRSMALQPDCYYLVVRSPTGVTIGRE